jgi:hypothetical protein
VNTQLLTQDGDIDEAIAHELERVDDATILGTYLDVPVNGVSVDAEGRYTIHTIFRDVPIGREKSWTRSQQYLLDRYGYACDFRHWPARWRRPAYFFVCRAIRRLANRHWAFIPEVAPSSRARKSA